MLIGACVHTECPLRAYVHHWYTTVYTMCPGAPPDGPLLRRMTALLVLLLALAAQCACQASPAAALLLLATCAAAVWLCGSLVPALQAWQRPRDDDDDARRLVASASRLLRPLETALWGSECVVLQLVDCEIRQRAAAPGVLLTCC